MTGAHSAGPSGDTAAAPFGHLKRDGKPPVSAVLEILLVKQFANRHL
jgi:hypothetical protein